jgi:hypothetical protein
MNTASQVSGALRDILTHPEGGIPGLVDDVLAVCLEHGLQFDWQTDCLRVRSAGGDWEDSIDVPLRKSVFRAILARVATLCNERTPGSVSPYGGRGELSVGADPTAVISVAFVNTPETQQLELLMTPTEQSREA